MKHCGNVQQINVSTYSSGNRKLLIVLSITSILTLITGEKING
jgi:hypothetical protein